VFVKLPPHHDWRVQSSKVPRSDLIHVNQLFSSGWFVCPSTSTAPLDPVPSPLSTRTSEMLAELTPGSAFRRSNIRASRFLSRSSLYPALSELISNEHAASVETGIEGFQVDQRSKKEAGAHK
jgi:hypothetical protein